MNKRCCLKKEPNREKTERKWETMKESDSKEKRGVKGANRLWERKTRR